MRLADLAMLLLGWLLSTWGASLVLRAAAARVARLRNIPPFSSMFRGSSPFDPAPGSVGSVRAGFTIALGLLCLVIGVYCLTTRPNLGTDDSYDIADVVAGAFGALLGSFAVGAMLIGFFADPSRGRRRCPRCWYVMDGLAQLRCPECGHEARSEPELLRTRRSGQMMLLGAVLLVLAVVPSRIASFRRGGLLAITPTPVLIAFMERLPETWLTRGSSAWANNDLYSEGPLLLRLNEAPAWERSWFQSRLRRLLVTTQDPEQFDSLMVVFGGISMPAFVEDPAQQQTFAASCRKFGSRCLIDLPAGASKSDTLNAIRRAIRILSYEEWLSGNAAPRLDDDVQQVIERCASDPDIAVFSESLTLASRLDDSRLRRLVPIFSARISAGGISVQDREFGVAFGRWCNRNPFVLNLWLQAVDDPANPGRGLLLGRVGQACSNAIDPNRLQRWRTSDDDRLACAAIYLLVARLGAGVTTDPPIDCDDLLKELARRTFERAFLLLALDRLQCSSDALPAILAQSLDSSDPRERRAALICGANLSPLSPILAAPLARALADPAMDAQVTGNAKLWAGMIEANTGQPPSPGRSRGPRP